MVCAFGILTQLIGKADITAIEYDWRSPHDFKTYFTPLPPAESTSGPQPLAATARQNTHRIQRRRPRRYQAVPGEDPFSEVTISRRRYVYKNKLYSLHVGSNRISKFKDFTPTIFSQSAELQTRARKWIRRELHVFDFLSPDADPTAARQATAGAARRANNAEFLLEYIIALLRTVDIKDSSGRADEKLADFLGVENARLFLHELESWLRSPYIELNAWDRAVQYQHALPSFEMSSTSTSLRKDSVQPSSSTLTRSPSRRPYMRTTLVRPSCRSSSGMASAAHASHVEEAAQRFQLD